MNKLNGDILVSIIITAHNYGRFLDKCINSVLSQTYTNIQIIVVDDGSTDNTQEVLRKYSSKIEKIIVLDGVGVGKASKIGVSESTGELFLRVDADDWLEVTMIERLLTAYLSNASCKAVYPGYYLFDSHNDCKVITQNISSPLSKLYEHTPLGSCALISRSAYEQIGGYNDELRYEEDYDFWHRFVIENKILHLQEPLFYYRRHQSNKSNNFLKKRSVRREIKRLKSAASGIFCSNVYLSDYTASLFPALCPHFNSSNLVVIENTEASFDKILDSSQKIDSIGLDKILKTIVRPEYYSSSCANIYVSADLNALSCQVLSELFDTLRAHDADLVFPAISDPEGYWCVGEHGLEPHNGHAAHDYGRYHIYPFAFAFRNGLKTSSHPLTSHVLVDLSEFKN